jgi:acyl-[acyl-carrier-protein]-phospholipid O-acyltransferase/long-chain-fatty-acid--[acyl-carrier-protein] ligase
VIVSPSLARQKFFRNVKNSFRHAVIDISDPAAQRRIDELWESNRLVVLFPEPEPTTNGLLMKLSESALAAVERSDAAIVPACACNTLFTGFSRMGDRLIRVAAPRVTLMSGAARRLDDAPADPTEGKFTTRRKIERMLNNMIMQGMWDKKPLFDTLIEQRRLWGGKRVVAMEPDGTRTDWNGFMAKIFVLQRIIEELTAPGERMGIMLPNTVIALAALIGTQHADREPAMINYSMGVKSLKEACATASVRTIVTSSRFVEEGKLRPLVDALTAEGLKIVYLEDRVSSLSVAAKLGCLAASRLARPTPDAERYAERTAVVLFTSGSEGTPKSVALSHLNIQANTAQVRASLDFYATDVMIDLMPMFHSFGLCTAAIMPLSAGMPVAFYPTPLHYKKIPQYAYEVKGTVLLGTNAFLAGYAKNSDPFDFFEMRYVVCGGDKMKESTMRIWYEKFGVSLLEGYGVTECSPVVGVNRRGDKLDGSIGLPLPCISVHLAPVEGVSDAGRLVVRGPNVMKGYIKPDGSIVPPPEDGYDTGDIVSISDDGFITIVGRAKRFAKIGGEMVSLALVEEAVQEIWPDDAHAVLSVPDEARGEVIVLLTERPSPDREELKTALIQKGLPELALPKKIITSEGLPRIGVGKIDYRSAAKIAADYSELR